MKKYILTIDTGTELTAYVLYNKETKQLGDRNWLPNGEVIEKLKKYFADCELCIIEMSAVYGAGASMSILANTLIIGLYSQLAKTYKVPVALMFRKTVKLELCGSIRSINDSAVNVTVRDNHFGERCKTKKNLSAFYFNEETKKNGARGELENNEWAALAILGANLQNAKCIGYKSQVELKKIDKALIEYFYEGRDIKELE